VRWALRQWKQDDELKQIDRDFATGQVEGERRWYVLKKDPAQTMVVISGPIEFNVGSPSIERHRRENEAMHKVSIDHSYSIAATAVTKEQFRRFRPSYPDDKELTRFCPDSGCPVIGITWYEAAEYCNWLSKQEGLQSYYLPNSRGKYEEGMKIAQGYERLAGFRLPTETEWEYASRAQSTSSRFFGTSDDWLGKYSWYVMNAEQRTWPVGRLKPNDFGLFDICGNACSWCQDRYDSHGPSIFHDSGEPLVDTVEMAARGGAFVTPPTNVRSAFRFHSRPLNVLRDVGLRIVRTLR
jgi:formylglycine-generating enzyme required for sulfatase activity